STGKPKGILHSTGGYLLGVAMTHKWVFDIREDDIYWCTADVGWVTGHSYIVYGPLANGSTVVMYEGAPNHPREDRFWEVIAKYKVTVFYTAPTAIRAFVKWGDKWPKGHDLSSLRLLGSVGEPINPEAWMWYHQVIGKGRCPIVDTWWQTETGAIMITPLPGAIPTKPGSATRPFPGIVAEVVDKAGTPVKPNEVKGEGIAAFVTLKGGMDGTEALKKELRDHVTKEIGALARPDDIRFTAALPKTRSGKIMRRLLRDIAAGKATTQDTTTLEDYTVLAKLREEEEG